MRFPRVTFQRGQRVGWLTLLELYDVPKKRGRMGERWRCRCRCGALHDASHENLQQQRVMACRACSKAFRAEEDRRMG